MSDMGLGVSLVPTSGSLLATTTTGSSTTAGKAAYQLFPRDTFTLSPGTRIPLQSAEAGSDAVGILAESLGEVNRASSVYGLSDSLYGSTLSPEEVLSWYYYQQWGVTPSREVSAQRFLAKQDLIGASRGDGAVNILANNYAFLNPPYDMRTGVWNDRIPGTPLTTEQANLVYDDFSLLDASNLETDRLNSLQTAFNNHSLKIQATDAVPGLNYRLNETRSVDSNGNLSRTISPTYTYLPDLMDLGQNLIGGMIPGIGPVFISW